MENKELKLLRDKWNFHLQFLKEKELILPETVEVLKETSLSIEKEYMAGRSGTLKEASRDIDDFVRQFPLPMALEYKKRIKEQLDIDYDVVDKIRLKAIEKLLKKGKISNPQDYELLLGRVEEIYADDNYKEEVDRINNVLLTYHK